MYGLFLKYLSEVTPKDKYCMISLKCEYQLLSFCYINNYYSDCHRGQVPSKNDQYGSGVFSEEVEYSVTERQETRIWLLN